MTVGCQTMIFSAAASLEIASLEIASLTKISLIMGHSAMYYLIMGFLMNDLGFSVFGIILTDVIWDKGKKSSEQCIRGS